MATGRGRIERGCDFGPSHPAPVRLAFLEIGGAGFSLRRTSVRLLQVSRRSPEGGLKPAEARRRLKSAPQLQVCQD